MNDLLINGYFLVHTCQACPEQYDVYNSNCELVSYFRLRHGRFTAVCPDVGGDLVHMSYTIGDGIFKDYERMNQLTAALVSVSRWEIRRGDYKN